MGSQQKQFYIVHFNTYKLLFMLLAPFGSNSILYCYCTLRCENGDRRRYIE